MNLRFGSIGTKPTGSSVSVYEDATEMLTGSLIIYIFADVREMAREGKLKNTQLSDLEPPMTSDKMIAAIQNNKDALAERAIDHEEVANRLLALKQAFHQSRTSSLGGLFAAMVLGAPKVRLTHFVDDNADKELVHAVVVNEARKRITLIFRGSVTQQDFIQDAKCAQKKVDNPAAHISSPPVTTTINVHSGFYEYLFKVNKTTRKPRIETIREDLRKLIRQYPGFHIYCAGHSLGGALCTLFGFYAASDDTIARNGPVTIVSVASPYVGNIKFRLAFQDLERKKRLRHLRIANAEDMVTLLPFASLKVGALSPIVAFSKGAGNLYKHVGMRLQLSDNKDDSLPPSYSLSFPKDHGTTDEEYGKEVRDSLDAGKSLMNAFYCLIKQDFATVKKHHSCEEYEARLEIACKEALSSLTLEDLYADKKLVGDTLNETYNPVLMTSTKDKVRRMFSVSRAPSLTK